MGSCGALLMSPEQIEAWAREVRATTNGAFQMNLWIPDPDPVRDPAQEAEVRAFLGQYGPEVPADAADAPDDAQAEAPAGVAVLRAGSDGVEVIQPATPQAAETRQIALDTISYSDTAQVQISGRANPGSVVRTIRPEQTEGDDVS